MTDGPSRISSGRERALALALIETCTVGLPFSAFKILSGLWLLETPVAPLGVALVALGAIDALFNAVNAATLALSGRRVLPICGLHFAATRVRPELGDLGLGLDTLLSFSLVAMMIALGAISTLPIPRGTFWSAAVVLNVFGAGILRLAHGLRPAPRLDRPAGLKLFQVHCGFYDSDVLDGNYESHVNFFVAANGFDEARAAAKALPDFQRKRMHVDGIQEIQAVDGCEVGLTERPALQGQTVLVSNKHRELAPPKPASS